MSYLLFLDESGHDHRSVPYEVRGGIALHAGRLWPFIQAMRGLEEHAFGAPLHVYGAEVKGHTLLDRDRFAWASQGGALEDRARRSHAQSFLGGALENRAPRRIEFTAYGQACLMMARGIPRLLAEHEAVLFASVVPRTIRRPKAFEADQYLRRDHVFLLERYYYFLESRQEHGLLVMDETEKTLDRRFVACLQRHFTQTRTGRERSAWLVPVPLFVSSDMTFPIQAADFCIYCINWGFRLPEKGMGAPARTEIAEEFGPWLNKLQFRGEVCTGGRPFQTCGIVYVPDPYGDGGAEKKEAGLSGSP